MARAQPYDRPLTEDEIRGFRMACACMAEWARQIERNGFRLGGPAEPMLPRHQVMRHSGRMARNLAEALALTIEQLDPASPAALPSA